MKPIPYGRQHITEEDINAIVDVLRSDYLTQGPKILKFEKLFAEYVGAKYAVAVSNGTAALHLSILTLDVKPGDKVITTPITFVATANCVLYAGGKVVFADIDPETYLLDIKKVSELLESSPKGTYKGIIPVDFAGRAVDMEAFRKLADDYGCWIVEDACHSPGGYFIDSNGENQNCGNGKFADASVFSFHPVKHITTGEGGMITTNNENIYKKLLLLRTHGITKDISLLSENHGGWYYEMQELGFNYRLTDFQAALGISQVERAEGDLKRRIEIVKTYYEAFREKPYILRQAGFVVGHAYHLYVVEVENRKDLYEYLHSKKIFSQVHYIPVHLMPYYKQFGWGKGNFPVAEKYYNNCLSLPLFPTLSCDEQKYVIDTISGFYE
jgi:UDP-4-amino-4,6-dideoxy-N-acetyl-beta-L-altrosamine transaminase